MIDLIQIGIGTGMLCYVVWIREFMQRLRKEGAAGGGMLLFLTVGEGGV